MFGYNVSPTDQAAPDAKAPAPVLSPGDAVTDQVAQAPGTAPQTADETVPYPAGQGLIAGKYWLGADSQRLPVGDLFHGKDVKQETELDILLVDKSVFHSPLDMERSRRELRQLQKVDCPAIVKVLDHGKAEDDRLYVVMERVAGTPLQQIVERQALGLGVAQGIVKAVGGGLAEAQKMGVIHRDIAPHNVLMTKDGSVKIRGFGVAAPIKRHVFGTPEFISPEQASGRPVDQRSNIYSLGALMFYMLTGRPVFSADSVEDLLVKHQKEEPPSPKTVKPDLNLPARAEALILKALSKSSSRRHLTLRQFLREVESLASATAAQEIAPPPKPVSFETPLHGVTALAGGKKPPTSEVPPVKRQQVVQQPSGRPAAPSDAPTVQGEMSAGKVRTAASAREEPVIPMPASPRKTGPAPAADGGMAKTMLDAGPPPGAEPSPPAPAAVKAPAPTPSAPAPAPAPQAAQAQSSDAQQPGTPQRQSQITGELSSEVSLKKPEPVPLAQQKKRAPKPASGPLPSAPPGAPKGGFRETMWFFKGEVESAMAAEGDEEVVKQQEVEATPEELANKYRDDGSLSDEAARRLSLRTGKTQAMQKVKVPSGHLPGEKMAAEDFISEMNRGKRIAIWVCIFILLAGIGGLVAWLVLH